MVQVVFRRQRQLNLAQFETKVFKGFGKTGFELDLAGEDGRILASEYPLSHVFMS